MLFAIATAISIITSVIWLTFIYKLDRYNKEPFLFMLKTFVAGALFSFLALVLNTFFSKMLGNGYGMLLVGLVEEGVKILAFYAVVYKSKEFDEPLDGVLYAGIVALGFGFAENILYNMQIMKITNHATASLIIRGFMPFVHVLFASVWGYAIGEQKRYIAGKKMVFAAYIIAAAAHSFYDISAFVFPLFSLVIVIVLLFLFIGKIKNLNRVSPYNNFYLINCPNCKAKIKENSQFCPNCSKKIFIFSGLYKIYCPNCQQSVLRSWKFCKNCGKELNKFNKERGDE